MGYEFVLRKPLVRRGAPDLLIVPTAQQIELVEQITAILLNRFGNYLALTDQIALLTSGLPFHLFELGEELCRSVGMPMGCSIMIELISGSARLLWCDDDRAALERKPIGELQKIARGLGSYTSSPSSFAQLTENVRLSR